MRMLVLFVAAPALAQPLVGWGIQDGHPLWSIEIAEDAEGHRIAYPDLGCWGRLEPVAPGAAPLTGRFEELIVEGTDVCVAYGIIDLTDIGKGVRQYEWRRDLGSPVEACGALVPDRIDAAAGQDLARRICR